MPVPNSYLTTSKNLRGIMEAVRGAGVPTRFTYEFLKQLGYPSSGDRPVIAVMKALGFLNEGGEPTERYRRFKDPAQAKAVVAEAMRDAYADVFTVDQQANTKTASELKGIFARLSDKGEAVNTKMATTFKALAEMADFKTLPAAPLEVSTSPPKAGKAPAAQPMDAEKGIAVHHDVHIHLPESTNIAVYDAIFRSLREHLA